ncbi:hypothetical protein TK78_06650 [Streptomyces sp. Tue 6075]|nr:hypothetical protein TK78_06650 [Streptomyces sp. Tue 6075]APS18665.1 hypothetical protein TK78_06650 [Streptomyces sp. Tue 6075]
MPSEEFSSEDNVMAFRRARGTAGPVNGADELPGTAQEPGASPATVLNAERGIINTGTVHGGQHITTVELSDRLDRIDRGADGDL